MQTDIQTNKETYKQIEGDIHKLTERHTVLQIDRQINIQIDRQINIQIDRQIDRQIDNR